MPSEPRQYRAGESLEDFCRACKTDRLHTVVATDAEGRPLRVACGYCRSEHNYRGGPRIGSPDRSPAAPERAAGPRSTARTPSSREPFPIVSERERVALPMTLDRDVDLEMILRRIIREESGVTAAAPAEKWRGGTLVMVRNRLRTLEQQVNAAALPDDVKVRLQGYISGCYGSLTSFNVLFADEDDQFKGSGGD